jgi:hypothetical protein
MDYLHLVKNHIKNLILYFLIFYKKINTLKNQILILMNILALKCSSLLNKQKLKLKGIYKTMIII